MPLLDSFKVDHVKMEAPSLRVAKTLVTKEGSNITIYDFRIHKPNIDMMSESGTHTLEHLIAGFIRDNISKSTINHGWEVIDVSPMGCRTGFYISIVGKSDLDFLNTIILKSMVDVINTKSESDIPELNAYQCGSYTMHSLTDAKDIAHHVINKGLKLYSGNELELDFNLIRK